MKPQKIYFAFSEEAIQKGCPSWSLKDVDGKYFEYTCRSDNPINPKKDYLFNDAVFFSAVADPSLHAPSEVNATSFSLILGRCRY